MCGCLTRSLRNVVTCCELYLLLLFGSPMCVSTLFFLLMKITQLYFTEIFSIMHFNFTSKKVQRYQFPLSPKSGRLRFIIIFRIFHIGNNTISSSDILPPSRTIMHTQAHFTCALTCMCEAC